MKQSEPTKNLPSNSFSTLCYNENSQGFIPFPEITCKCCSGKMDIVANHEQQVIPASSSLCCSSCGFVQEIFFEKSNSVNFVNPIFGDESNICPLCHQLILINK